MSQILRSAAAVLAATLALSGCFGPNDPYPPGATPGTSYNNSNDSNSNYAAPPPATDPTTPSLTLEKCGALEVASRGQLSLDVVGTWQDWNGGSMKLVTFAEDGTVSVSAYPADAAGLPDEQQAPVVELKGTWAVTDTTLSIRWENGIKEGNDALVDTYPGCTMLELTVPKEGTSQLPNPSQLERVTCPTPVVQVGVVQ